MCVEGEEQPASVEEKDKIVAAAAASARVPAAVARGTVVQLLRKLGVGSGVPVLVGVGSVYDQLSAAAPPLLLL